MELFPDTKCTCVDKVLSFSVRKNGKYINIAWLSMVAHAGGPSNTGSKGRRIHQSIQRQVPA
jgi:hypothetical protein